jgi:Pyridoxamine 5'-phosphate oxidase
MSDLTPTQTKNLDGYGFAELEWSRALAALKVNSSPTLTHWLGTTRPDGTPHAAGVGVQYQSGFWYFTSNPSTRKARNLAANPHCTISAALPGIDLVAEGTAARVTDPDTLELLASVFREDGWPAEVAGDALTAPFSAPSAGPPPWHVYRFTFHQAVGVSTKEPYGATRWRFTR